MFAHYRDHYDNLSLPLAISLMLYCDSHCLSMHTKCVKKKKKALSTLESPDTVPARDSCDLNLYGFIVRVHARALVKEQFLSAV